MTDKSTERLIASLLTRPEINVWATAQVHSDGLNPLASLERTAAMSQEIYFLADWET